MKCFESIVDKELASRMKDPDVLDFVRGCNEKYIHWEKFRYRPVPEGFDHLAQQVGISPS